MKLWYVLQTKPHKESTVVAQLRQAGYSTFFPILHNCFGTKSLFPSYVFVQLESGSSHDYRMAGFTRGALRILGTQECGPVAVPESAVSLLRQRADDRGIIRQTLFSQIGEKIQVQRGILKDLVGVLEKPMDATGRLQVLFKMFNRSMRAVLSAQDVVPIMAS